MDMERLNQTLNRIRDNLFAPGKTFQLKTGKEIQVIRPQDIYVVEAMKKKAIIYLEARQFIVDHSITEIEERLELHKDLFYRSCRSFLVNLSKIRVVKPVSRSSFEIAFFNTDCKAYLSKAFYTDFMSKLELLAAKGE